MTDDTTKWRVLMRWEDVKVSESAGLPECPLWVELDDMETDRSHSSPSAEDLGQAHGAGTFLLIKDGAFGVETKTVEAVTSFEEAAPVETVSA